MHITYYTKIAIIALLPSILSGCAGSPPTFTDSPSTLTPCPSSPNCVSSVLDKDDSHFIAPIESTLSIEQKHKRLYELLSQHANVSLIKTEPQYIRAEFTSSFWGFVDDVEFIITDTQIHMRSASRLGYSDLGANRSRLERLRSEF
ncbi:DUF1499 domain-containing protein [Pseudomonas sp. HK3]|jgi:uncharacterized protein (DUF1499 family)